MRAYYFDNLPGDQRLPHDSGRPVPDEILKSIGILYWHIPTNQQSQIDVIVQERNTKDRDIITITKEGLGDLYEPKLKIFSQEYVMPQEVLSSYMTTSGTCMKMRRSDMFSRAAAFLIFVASRKSPIHHTIY